LVGTATPVIVWLTELVDRKSLIDDRRSSPTIPYIVIRHTLDSDAMLLSRFLRGVSRRVKIPGPQKLATMRVSRYMADPKADSDDAGQFLPPFGHVYDARKCYSTIRSKMAKLPAAHVQRTAIVMVEACICLFKGHGNEDYVGFRMEAVNLLQDGTTDGRLPPIYTVDLES